MDQRQPYTMATGALARPSPAMAATDALTRTGCSALNDSTGQARHIAMRGAVAAYVQDNLISLSAYHGHGLVVGDRRFLSPLPNGRPRGRFAPGVGSASGAGRFRKNCASEFRLARLTARSRRVHIVVKFICT